MASSQIFIARDDAGGKDLNFGPSSWSTTSDPHWFGGSTSWPKFAYQNTSSPLGSMNFTFQGTSVALYGNTPPAPQSQTFLIGIDGAAPYNTSTTDTNPQTYMQWYQSPLLPEGEHNIIVENLPGTAIDLIIITPGANTPLDDETLMVDDTFSGIIYEGEGWQQVPDSKHTSADSNTSVMSFQNGTHRTSNIGNSLLFSYTGTNLQLFGVLRPSLSGSLSLSYTIDNSSPFTMSHTAPAPENDQHNYLLLDTGPLPAGNHTLNVTLAASIGQTLIVDYILYAPSFSTLVDMPDLATITAHSSASLPPPLPSSNAAPNLNKQASKAVGAGAIVGGVFTGVVMLFMLISLLVWLQTRRNRLKKVQSDPAYRVEQYVYPPDSRLPCSQPNTDKGATSHLLAPAYSPRGTLLLSNGSYDARPLRSPVSLSMLAHSSGSIVQRHTEIQQRLRELEPLVERSSPSRWFSMPSKMASSSTGDSREENHGVAELRRHIELLQEENKRLAVLSEPPAYRDRVS